MPCGDFTEDIIVLYFLIVMALWHISSQCHFHDDKALCSNGLDDNVWSERRLDDVWILQLLVQVYLKYSVADALFING